MSTDIELKTVPTNVSTEQRNEYDCVKCLRCRACSPCAADNCHCSDHIGVGNTLNSQYNHDVVVHDDHLDIVLNGSLHHLHNDHFDNHGLYDPENNKPANVYLQNLRSLM